MSLYIVFLEVMMIMTGMALESFILGPGTHMSCQIGVPGIFGGFQYSQCPPKENVYKKLVANKIF